MTAVRFAFAALAMLDPTFNAVPMGLEKSILTW